MKATIEGIDIEGNVEEVFDFLQHYVQKKPIPTPPIEKPLQNTKKPTSVKSVPAKVIYRNSWTPFEDTLITTSGLSVRALSRKLGRTRGAITQRRYDLRKHGVKVYEL